MLTQCLTHGKKNKLLTIGTRGTGAFGLREKKPLSLALALPAPPLSSRALRVFFCLFSSDPNF